MQLVLQIFPLNPFSLRNEVLISGLAEQVALKQIRLSGLTVHFGTLLADAAEIGYTGWSLLINAETVQVGTGSNLSDLPTSMIGPGQEAKSPPDALGRSAGVISWLSQRVVLASRSRFLFVNRTRHPLAGAARLAAQQD